MFDAVAGTFDSDDVGVVHAHLRESVRLGRHHFRPAGAEWMGHANKTTTELVYTHLYAKADHAEEVAAPGALATQNVHGDKVIQMYGLKP